MAYDAEARMRSADEMTRSKTGLSLFHWLALGAAAASVTLFALGKKNLAIFVGLWPPTITALRGSSR
jgi:hypothetical protein